MNLSQGKSCAGLHQLQGVSLYRALHKASSLRIYNILPILQAGLFLPYNNRSCGQHKDLVLARGRQSKPSITAGAASAQNKLLSLLLGSILLGLHRSLVVGTVIC